ncbi:TPA: cupin domain-containing protein [Burkholderia cenocepacia]|uniref:Cupin domain-containing protein n=1 Tax=Burkholderia latens TaxID=488446 RepID=A0A6H9SXB1_9BURK|nr:MULTISPECIES: cupin domain-containing protein [Burkholderia]KAB0644516.1 cupin domain-containing protein [Burkholderia latens]MBJ9923925.1 cupin domain-containing protein [Burkholderia cenocepacia]UJH78769.1 cupin domain-containing protein [Burkholderia cenocepacia]HDR9879668.1 cupin domain-containing protein [Burkholderia cenocepacia]HDR9886757.1 cupin domain-containing protein [Burkholderia cenocepacia]
MSSFIRFDFENLGTPRIGAPLPERAIEGSQVFSTWDIDQANTGDVRTGVWEVTPGAYRSIKGSTWELCVILSGVSEITEDGQAPIVVKAGDTFVMKPGFEGTWRVIETTRKIWVTKD